MHPDYPIVSGEYQMTDDWSVALPGKFNRRVEDGDLVIWRPGFTIWVSVWHNNKKQTVRERYECRLSERSPESFDVTEAPEDTPARFSYRLKEDADDARVAAFYGFAFGSDSEVMMAIYFNNEQQLDDAVRIWRSLKETR